MPVEKFEKSKIILERTLNDSYTDKATSYYYLGQIALKDKKTDQAKGYFEEGVAIDAKNPYNYVGFAAIELNIGDKKVADANVKLAKKYGKKDATLLVEIARMYHEADAVAYAEDVKNAMKEALKVDPKSEAYFIFIGDTIAKTASTYNEIVRAVENYDNAIYCNPNSVIPYVKYSGLYKNINLEFSIKKNARMS